MDLPYPKQVTLFHDQTEETDGDRSRQRAGGTGRERPTETSVRLDGKVPVQSRLALATPTRQWMLMRVRREKSYGSVHERTARLFLSDRTLAIFADEPVLT
jgi:hypothetical protein